MENPGLFLLSLVVPFSVCSIPFGFIIGKLNGVDLRDHGSGNIGATNALRILGKRKGIVTLILDTFKGILSLYLALLVYPYSENYLPLLGLFAILGHCYTPLLKFKGGKGVATGLGVFLVINPTATLMASVVFLIILYMTKYVSLSSISSAIYITIHASLSLYYYESAYLLLNIISLVFITSLIIHRHKENIRKLKEGRENKFFNK